MKPIGSEIYTRGPHPEERALARVSKDGGARSRLRPPFETHRGACHRARISRDPLAMLLRMRLNDGVELIPALKTLY
jgi:hypothetical protein